jgi:hypothetical protein
MPIKQDVFKHYFEFDGKRYTISVIRNNKEAAEEIAGNLRRQGFLARVLQYSGGVQKYAVYKRKADTQTAAKLQSWRR